MDIEASAMLLDGDATSATDAGERRQGRRHVTVLRVAKIARAHGDELCVIRNISDGGVMAHLYAPACVGERVTIEFKSGARLSGVVRWVRSDDAGIQFDHDIDIERFLAGEGDVPSASLPRAPRLGVGLSAVARIGMRMHPVSICDISQGGMKLRALSGVGVDHSMVVRVAGLAPLSGKVRWRDDHFIGLEFDAPLSFTILARWAADMDGRN